MIQVEELFIEPTATVLETLRKLDVTGQRILFIAPEGKLKAVITDGDIRKFFLRGGTPDQTVDHAANYHPLSVPIAERGRAREILQKNCIDALPVLNKRGVITDIIFAHGLNVDNRKQVDIPVVMMAGGLGTRLYQNSAQAADSGGRAAHCGAYHGSVPGLRLPRVHNDRELQKGHDQVLFWRAGKGLPRGFCR